MKAREFLKTLERLLANERDGQDLELSIVTKDNSIGPISKVSVRDVSFGIDWDHGHLLIWPDKGLVRE